MLLTGVCSFRLESVFIAGVSVVGRNVCWYWQECVLLAVMRCSVQKCVLVLEKVCVVASV